MFSSPLCLLLCCLLIGVVSSHGHEHAHEHAHGHDEPAHFKYSREANADDRHDHGHAHSHDAHHGHSHSDHAESAHGHAHESHKKAPTEPEREVPYAKALLSTLAICVCPVFILLFVRIENTAEHQDNLNVLLAFASGGLLGDAFLHLIPHAIEASGDGGHGHSHAAAAHGHSHGGEEGAHVHDLSVGLWVLGGILSFLCVEMFVRSVTGGHGHQHGHADLPTNPPPATKSREEQLKSPPTKKVRQSEPESAESDTEEVTKVKRVVRRKSSSSPPPAASGVKKKHKLEDSAHDLRENSTVGEVAPTGGGNEHLLIAGYLNLAADFTHNFTDGMAVGAGFLLGDTIGFMTAFTVILHEVPHEIGDYAILIKSGCSSRKAMLLQLTTAVGAILGTLFAFIAPGSGTAASWILPFTAGGFIYIATVSVLPELLQSTSLWQSVKQVLALLVGIAMMIFIAKFE